MPQLNERGAVSKQMICVRADQLLNITVTKTGLELLQRLSTLFNDVYNKRLPPGEEDDDQPMISIINRTGKDITVDQLQRIQVRLIRWISFPEEETNFENIFSFFMINNWNRWPLQIIKEWHFQLHRKRQTLLDYLWWMKGIFFDVKNSMFM